MYYTEGVILFIIIVLFLYNSEMITNTSFLLGKQFVEAWCSGGIWRYYGQGQIFKGT